MRGTPTRIVRRSVVATPVVSREGLLQFSHVRLLLRYIDPQHEGEWVPRAIGLSVRRLEDALVEALGSRKKPAPPGDDDDHASPGDDADPAGRWVEARLSPFALLKWDLSLEIVRKMVGADLSDADVVDLMLPEFMLGAGARIAQSDCVRWYRPVPKEPPQPGDPGTPEHLERCRNVQRFLEDETRHWSFLPWEVPEVEVAEFAHLPDDLVDPWDLDQHLRLVCRLAQRVETYLARLLFAVNNHGLWRDMQFTSFGHYVVERLGMSRRNAQALVALRRRFFDLPRTAEAFLDGSITRAQAEVLVRIADEDYEHEWIEYARKVSYIHLKRLVKTLRSLKERNPGEFWAHHRRPPLLPDVEAQTCAPTAEEADSPLLSLARLKAENERMLLEMIGSSERIPVRFFLPADMEEVWSGFTSLCDAASRGKATTADYLEVLADALLEEYGTAAIQQEKGHPTQSRAYWQCLIPTCSGLTNFQEHHVVKRSQGGSNHPCNLSNPCTGHHQAGIHAGHITVTGTAPNDLTVRQGVSPDGRVHLTFINGVLVNES